MKNKEKYMLAIFLKNDDESYSFQGTGFVINRFGLFFSAGHVFKIGNFDKHNFYCALPSNNSELFPITHLDIKYQSVGNRKGPVHNDLAFGKINKGFKIYAKLKRKRPFVNDLQNIVGYCNYKKSTNKNRFFIKECGRIDISDIDFEIVNSRVENRFAIISEDRRDYEKTFNLVENSKKYNNCITLRYAAHHGVSGGTVFNSVGSITGVYFGGPDNHRISHCIASKYAKRTLIKRTNLKFK
jgi:hypothetical protein